MKEAEAGVANSLSKARNFRLMFYGWRAKYDGMAVSDVRCISNQPDKFMGLKDRFGFRKFTKVEGA